MGVDHGVSLLPRFGCGGKVGCFSIKKLVAIPNVLCRLQGQINRRSGYTNPLRYGDYLLVVLVGWSFYQERGKLALDRLSVVFVLILATLFLAETAKWTTWFGAALLTLGAILMVV